MKNETPNNNRNQVEDLTADAWYDNDQTLGDLVDQPESAADDLSAIHEAAEAEANGEQLKRSTVDKLGALAVKDTMLNMNVAAVDKTPIGQFQLPSLDEGSSEVTSVSSVDHLEDHAR